MTASRAPMLPHHVLTGCCSLLLPVPVPRDLWRITTFLREKGFDADLAACRSTFPDLLTFEQFLAATNWGDASRMYEEGIRFDGPLPPPSSSSSRKGAPLTAGRK
jgi:hypothetical protein